MGKKFLSFVFVFLMLTSSSIIYGGAVRNEIPDYIEGAVDLNGDGACNIKDVTLILRHIVNAENLSGDALAAADINGDGEVNVKDATALRKIILYADVPVREVLLSTHSLSMRKGETAQLNAAVTPSSANDTSLKFASSNSKIVSVDQSGKVTAVSFGTADITVSAASGASAVCTVEVIERSVKSVKLNMTSVILNKSETAQLTVTLSPSNADNKTVTYTSSNPSAATVSASGKITAKGWGSATITATAASGAKATCVVNASDIIETNLKFKVENSELREGGPKGIVLHHAAGSGPVENIHAGHLQNPGWAGIGYHFYVRKDGTVYRGRPEEWLGAHASNFNDYIGICSEGNFEKETMTAAQKNAVIEIVSFIQRKYKVSKIYGHRDVDATACPGKNYPFDEIVNRSKQNAAAIGLEHMTSILEEIFPYLPVSSFATLPT